MSTTFKAMFNAQLKAFLRDKQSLFWIMLFPLFFLFVFGGIFGGADETQRSKVVQVGAVPLFDQMPQQGKDALNQLFEISKSDDANFAVEQVRTGKASGVVSMQGTTLRLQTSPADQVKAAIVRGTLESFVNNANLNAAQVKPRFNLQVSLVQDEALRPIQYYVPGLLSYAIAMSGTFGAAMVLVNWRNSKLLRRLRLSPVSTGTMLGSRAVITLMIALMQLAVFLAVGLGLFGLKLTGFWWLSIPVLLSGALAFMAVGLFAGAISRTADGASGLANLLILPMSFLSGAFIPVDIGPDWMQVLAKVLPMGQLNSGMSAVMVRGQGVEAIWVPILVLLAFGALFALIASRVFKWDNA